MTDGSESQANLRSSNSIRTFICIEVPDSLKERIDKLQQTLRQQDAKISWVKPSNIHLTLRFLGEVASACIPEVGAAVERAALRSRPIEIEVGTTGCFPSVKRPRVFWVGLPAVPDALADLHALIEEELAIGGFPPDDRRFSPHLTIGRVRSPQNASRVAENLITTGFACESFQAAKVIVMRSEMNPGGSIYSPLFHVPLGPGF
ncbi:MAG: RNA 2',3'-cyclic phosphodiesterase [Blastocatellia bacterium]